MLGQPGIGRGDPDYFPLYVGNHILGGGGFVSRLYEEVREKRGLSYGAYSYFSPRRGPGPFTASLQTRGDQQEQALQVMRETIRAFIDHGPTQEELEAAQKNISGGFPLRLDSNRKILGYIAMIGFYGLPLDYLDTFVGKVNAVTGGTHQGCVQTPPATGSVRNRHGRADRAVRRNRGKLNRWGQVAHCTRRGRYSYPG